MTVTDVKALSCLTLSFPKFYPRSSPAQGKKSKTLARILSVSNESMHFKIKHNEYIKSHCTL